MFHPIRAGFLAGLLFVATPAFAQSAPSVKQQLDTMVADVASVMTTLSSTVAGQTAELVRLQQDLAAEKAHSAALQKTLDASKPAEPVKPGVIEQLLGPAPTPNK